MFGYVRVYKPYLLMCEFTTYRAYYCGLCKAIKRRYGNLKRVTVTYDLTFLTLLLSSLLPTEPNFCAESCILNPLVKKSVAKDSDVLDYAADLSMLFAYFKALDNLKDEKKFAGLMARLTLWRAYRRAKKALPEENLIIADMQHTFDQADTTNILSADIFGKTMQNIADKASEKFLPDLAASVKQAVSTAMYHLARWIYIMDAADDYESDLQKKQANPFSTCSREQMQALCRDFCAAAEAQIDKYLAILPYKRYGGIISNVVTLGLKDVRERILAGQKLPKV